MSFESGLILHTGDPIIKRKLTGFVYNFGIQHITANSWILLAKLISCLEWYNLCFLIIWSLILLFINVYYHSSLIKDNEDLVIL